MYNSQQRTFRAKESRQEFQPCILCSISSEWYYLMPARKFNSSSKAAEEERFDSLWVWERLISPLKPQTPYPLTPDGSFPIEFQSLFEPLEALTFVAANTNKISLGNSMLSADSQIPN